MILKVNGIEFSYPSRPVLQGVRFQVNRGEFFAILGNNGAGKSTLLKCLNRILKPTSGAVYIGERDIFSLRQREVARQVGYVAQRQERPHMTVFDAVLLGRRPHMKWSLTSADTRAARQALQLLELEDYAMRFLDELSGGELQKVVLARAIAQEPEVLLLDEPTSNLDLKNQVEVLQLVRRIAREKNIAVIVVIHDLNLALRYADRFLLLKDGTVFALGGREIMTPANISAVYGLPVEVVWLGKQPVVVPVEEGEKSAPVAAGR